MMLRLALLLIWFPLAGFAQTFPEPLSDTVSDYADLLPPEAEVRVMQTLQSAREQTGVHIALVIIDRQSTYGGTGRFADFATRWFNAWGVGDAGRNDGVLIVIGRNDREMRIVLGDGYDVVWDGRAQRVIDTAFLPAFRADDYVGGIEAGAISAVERIARPFAAREQVTEDSGFPETDTDASAIGTFLVFIGLVVAVVTASVTGAFGRMVLRFRRCPTCNARGLTRQRDILVEPGELTQGEGVETLRCQKCQTSRETPFLISSHAENRRRAKSSSSGFGGGRSSGGGASGKW